jgi:hypothetical protein
MSPLRLIEIGSYFILASVRSASRGFSSRCVSRRITETEVFISWSGEQSKSFAEALRNWLPKIVNAVEPWLSSADIDKGARWSADVAAKLEASKIGIICLTPGNMHSDWILFEGGALSKTITNTHVCRVLIGLEPSALHGPSAQFQAT